MNSRVAAELNPIKYQNSSERPVSFGLEERQRAAEAARQAEIRRQQELTKTAVKLANEQRRRVGELVVGGQGDRQVPVRMVEVIASLLIAVTDGLLLQSVLDPLTCSRVGRHLGGERGRLA